MKGRSRAWLAGPGGGARDLERRGEAGHGAMGGTWHGTEMGVQAALTHHHSPLALPTVWGTFLAPSLPSFKPFCSCSIQLPRWPVARGQASQGGVGGWRERQMRVLWLYQLDRGDL